MKVTINKGDFKGIPYLEYCTKDANKLLFLQHGIYGSKEKVMQLLGIKYAKMGYCVVGIDARSHGERAAYPFDPVDKRDAALNTFEVVKETVNDLLMLYHGQYSTFKSLNILGISMGGLMAYYLATQTNHVDRLIALISSPNFTESFLYTTQAFGDISQDEIDQKLAMIKTMDPAVHAPRLSFKKALLISNKDDNVIPYKHTETFVKNNPDLPIQFELLEGEHRLTPAMQKAIEKVLKTTD